MCVSALSLKCQLVCVCVCDKEKELWGAGSGLGGGGRGERGAERRMPGGAMKEGRNRAAEG